MGATQSSESMPDNGFMASIDLACVSLSAIDSWPPFSPQAEQDIQAIKTLHSQPATVSTSQSINTPSPHSRKRSRASRHQTHLTTPDFSDNYVSSFNNKCKMSPPRPPEMQFDNKPLFNQSSSLSSTNHSMHFRQRGAVLKPSGRTFNFDQSEDVSEDELDQSHNRTSHRRVEQSLEQPSVSFDNVPIALSTFAHSNLGAVKSISRRSVRSLLRATEIKSASPKRPIRTAPSLVHHISPLRLRKSSPTHTVSEASSHRLFTESCGDKSQLIPASQAYLQCLGNYRSTTNLIQTPTTHSTTILIQPSTINSSNNQLIDHPIIQDINHTPVISNQESYSVPDAPQLDISFVPSPPCSIPDAPELTIPLAPAFVGEFAPPPPAFESAPPCPPPFTPSIGDAPNPHASKQTESQIKLKKVHWQALTGCDAVDTIFGQTADVVPRIDLADITKKFAVASISKPSARSNQSVKPINPSNVRVIDAKRATNINIAIKRFRMTSGALTEAVLILDPLVTSSEEQCLSLISMIPRPDEVKSLRSFVSGRNAQPDSSKIEQLSDVEQLLLSFSAIPQLEQRLQAISFMLTFDRCVAQIVDQLTIIEHACLQVRSSESLRLVMHIILTVGNALNNTSAQGFRLGLLSSLSSVKTNDQSNLFDYVVNIVRTQCDKKTRHLVEELKQVRSASKIESAVLTSDTQSIQDQLSQCAELLSSISKSAQQTNNDAAFVFRIAEFVSNFESVAAALIERLSRVTNVTTALTKYFGEPDWSSERFFDQLDQFITQFQTINEDLDEKERRQERAAQHKQTKLKSLPQSRANRNDENVINQSFY